MNWVNYRLSILHAACLGPEVCQVSNSKGWNVDMYIIRYPGHRSSVNRGCVPTHMIATFSLHLGLYCETQQMLGTLSHGSGVSGHRTLWV